MLGNIRGFLPFVFQTDSSIQHLEGPAISCPDTSFLGFSRVFKQVVVWFLRYNKLLLNTCHADRPF